MRIHRHHTLDAQSLPDRHRDDRNPDKPAPEHFKARERWPLPHRGHHSDKRLRSPHRDMMACSLRHYFTTRFTMRPLTTMVLPTVLPTSRAATFSSARAAALIVSSSLSAATFTTFASLPLICTGISISL